MIGNNWHVIDINWGMIIKKYFMKANKCFVIVIKVAKI